MMEIPESEQENYENLKKLQFTLMEAYTKSKADGVKDFSEGKYASAYQNFSLCQKSLEEMKNIPFVKDIEVMECLIFGNISNSLLNLSGNDEKIEKDKAEFFKTNKYPTELSAFQKVFAAYSEKNSFVQLIGANLFITKALKIKPKYVKYLIWRIRILLKLGVETVFKYILEFLKNDECDKDMRENMKNSTVEKLSIIKDTNIYIF